MKKEKLSKIVDGVYHATISGSLKWSLSNSIFNNDTKHKYESLSSDGITKFSCSIELEDNLSLRSSSIAGRYSIHISNPNMIDDGVHLYSNDYPIIESIQKWIYKTHILPNLKVANQEKVMDDILKGIDVAEFRDKKIENILGESESKDVPKNDVKKGILGRIFGK